MEKRYTISGTQFEKYGWTRYAPRQLDCRNVNINEVSQDLMNNPLYYTIDGTYRKGEILALSKRHDGLKLRSSSMASCSSTDSSICLSPGAYSPESNAKSIHFDQRVPESHEMTKIPKMGEEKSKIQVQESKQGFSEDLTTFGSGNYRNTFDTFPLSLPYQSTSFSERSPSVRTDRKFITKTNQDEKCKTEVYPDNARTNYQSQLNQHFSNINEIKETKEEIPLLKDEENRILENGNVSLMTNIDFFKSLDPLQKNMNEVSVRLQSLIGNHTEYGLLGTSIFKQLQLNVGPQIQDVIKALKIIPRVLSTAMSKNEYVEIGDSNTDHKYQICQPSFEKAVSKYSIKDAAIVLAECDLFLSKEEKLESTIGRISSSVGTGIKLKPLDPAKLSALYSIIADKKKMPNIQRTEECTNLSPDFLTVKEQKMVREALSQYFNQLRQRQKRKRSNPDYACTTKTLEDTKTV